MKTKYPLTILFIITFIGWLITSCTPQQRLNRKVYRTESFARKHGLTTKDTLKVTVRDTIYFESVVHDTTSNIVYHDTTIIVNTERLRAVYFYDTLTREIWHEIQCKGDTVYKEKIIEVPVERNSVTEEKKGLGWWHWVIFVCGGFMVLYFTIKILRKAD